MKGKTKTPPKKYQLRGEDDMCTQIWKYDLSKNPYGPISVETIWKKSILNQWKTLYPDKDNE